VISQRGDRLKIDKENLSKAEIYLGIEGIRYGLVDRIGTRSDALEGAASLARIANYRIVDINKKMNITLHSSPQLLSSNESTPVNYYRYVEFYEGWD
jgi:ClpP class serine protease